MSKDPNSGIGRAYLLDHLPKGALIDEVNKALQAKGRPKLRGKSGHCPFSDHEDKHRSFSVTDGKGWTCHGCGRKGKDVIDFRISLDGLTLDDTIADLAREYSITRPVPPKGRKAAIQAPTAPRNAQELLAYLLTLPDHSALSEALHAALLGPEGKEARAYLEGRGILEDAWIRHGLGYVAPGQRPGAPLGPAWEGMVTFPIRAGEQVIAFAGRAIRPDADPGKLNTPGAKWPFNMNALLLEWEIPPQVYLAEGPISALALEAIYGEPAAALLGSDIKREWWPLFTRLYSEGGVILALDPKKGETPAELEARSLAIASRMRRLGFWRYLRFPDGMDPADVWKASGFSAAEAKDRAELVIPTWRYHPPAGNAFDVLLPDGPDKEIAEKLAGMVAKNTPGLTLTLHYEEGPGLGYHLEFSRRDGRPFRALDSVILLYVQQPTAALSEDAYQEGGLEVNLELMRAIAKVRRGVHLAAAAGLDPALVTAKRKPRPLPDTAKMATPIMSRPAISAGRGAIVTLGKVAPQVGEYQIVPVDDSGMPDEQLRIFETLTTFHMNVSYAVYALFGDDPLLQTSTRTIAKVMGLNPDSGKIRSDIIKALETLWHLGWVWEEKRKDGTRKTWHLRLIAEFGYDDEGRLTIGMPPITHQILTEGRKGRDWMLVRLAEYRSLSAAEHALWSMITAHGAPREWPEETLASVISDNQVARKRRQQLHAALDGLRERGLIYHWEPIAGTTTGIPLIRIRRTPKEKRKLRRKGEKVLAITPRKD